MATDNPALVGQALVDFALHGNFPEDTISSKRVDQRDFAPALEALAAAKSKLEAEVHTINEETAPDVQSWVANAKTVEDDINRSRSLANEIVRRAEAPEVSGQTIRETEEKVHFLQREVVYNQQVREALNSIKHVNGLLDQVEQARNERRVLDSLHLLEKSWTALDAVRVGKSCRVMKILDMRAFELKSAVHEVFEHVWNALVTVDVDAHRVEIHQTREDEQMTLSEAFIGLQAYKEVQQRMALFWHKVDAAIIAPRTATNHESLPGISCQDHILSLQGNSDQSISSLFSDLGLVMGYFANLLPAELLQALSNVMMPVLIPRIISSWLDSAVPATLKDMDKFQEVIASVRSFCQSLKDLKYDGFAELQDWVDNAPRVWLSKCRENALDSVRNNMSNGLGSPKAVERIETQTVSRSEGKELAANGAPATNDEDGWGAWDDEADATATEASEPTQQANATQATPGIVEDDADAWGWGEEEPVEVTPAEPANTNANVDDDHADAWGWGDDDTVEQPATPAKPKAVASTSNQNAKNSETREMTLKESYHISSLPEPVLALISAILEDGASLVGSQSSPVAPAAAGLFGLPTLVLAMFRAVAPYYYSLDSSGGGNMFLYNDATYLAEQLAEFVTAWKARGDIEPRAVTMLRLDNEIKSLRSFAARAYASEMSTQRTILRDLLGGAQNLIQQAADTSDLTAQIEAATGRTRAMGATWADILSRSAWCQAVGSLVDTIATKLVADVMDLSGIGQDEAYNIASMIAKITELDDLFIQPGAGKDDVPMTAQYAENWLRLKYLSEVLQSNLPDVKFLWFESDLSLYFTVDEVVELIGLSFVDNARTREVVREIKASPHPRT
ncbi:Centromere/kinetochore Zw10-domain-containing protein [Apiospora arundinis]|uniref:Centromere/kinetochore Zw10-domain-containing protein n=1 Tax=Apiospora arundinis TaxID=335852 RepID=A0ABR2I307_9PEZI